MQFAVMSYFTDPINDLIMLTLFADAPVALIADGLCYICVIYSEKFHTSNTCVLYLTADDSSFKKPLLFITY